MRLSRLGYWLITLVLLTVVVVLVTGYWLSMRAEPVYQGELTLSGLSASVTLEYGPSAVPSIRGEHLEDVVFAQGYATAAERMWQMDLMRRAAQGRLAEAFGRRALPIDRLMRTIGLAQAAERNLAVLSPQAQALLQAYANGVNAYREQAGGRWPLEYLLTGLEPAPWGPQDSLAIGEYMAYLLSFNAREELAFLRVAQRLGVSRARELFPTDEGIPAEPPPPGLDEFIGPGKDGFAGLLDDPFAKVDQLSVMYGLPRPGPASNAWAVDGSRTADGHPMLANDPHLMASTPNIWFELELIAPGLHVTGAAIPGLPLVLIGHNRDLAWGMTTTMADNQDLVIERATADGRAVRRPHGSEPIREREEVIVVRAGEPQRLRIRETGEGVILNEVLGEDRGLPQDFVNYSGPYLLALRSTFVLPDTAFEGLLRLNTARSIEDARAAVGLFVHASQNVLIAHRDGRIAWQISGRLPIRESGDGSLPAPGWIAGNRWLGVLPASSNPAWSDPADGQLVSANHRKMDADHPVNVGRSWLAPYRAQRIAELLGDRSGLTLDDMAAIQIDQLGIEARHYQRALRAMAAELRQHDRDVWADAELLLDWDGRFTPDSRAAALFVLLRRALFHALLADELGPDLAAYMDVALLAYNGLQETVRSGHSSFWDDVSTPEQETPARIWARALHQARHELNTQAGPDATLGELRRLVFPHALSGQGRFAGVFGVGPLADGGDDYTVDVRKADAAQPERPIFIPGYRVLFTPGDWGASRSIQALGQSGHRLSPYRSDQLADWRAGRTRALMWNGPPKGETIGRLRLLPVNQGSR